MKKNTYIIAEIGQAHDGSLGILHSYIDAVAQTGADAAKFQTHLAEAESSSFEPFRVNFSYEDETRYDYWKRMEFTQQQWCEIAEHCKDVKIDFISSPFSIAAVELLESVGVDKYKIGSGEVSNFLMLDKIAHTGRDVILSSGMSDLSEIRRAYQRFEHSDGEISLLQCTTKYPTAMVDIGLNVIKELQNEFPKVSTGLSDHSGVIYPGLAAVALGAEILEAHIVFDKNMFGPDSSSSLSVQQFTELVAGVRAIDQMLVHPLDKAAVGLPAELKTMFGKALSVRNNLCKGHVLTIDDLETKKPGDKGIPAADYESVLGRRLNNELSKNQFLNWNDLNG